MNSMKENFRVATICGSLRYYREMLKTAEMLTSDGWIVLMPFVADYVGGKKADKRKQMLDRMHRVKIDMSECIYVIGTHIGESTRNEINYAQKTKKAVIYEVEFPDEEISNA